RGVGGARSRGPGTRPRRRGARPVRLDLAGRDGRQRRVLPPAGRRRGGRSGDGGVRGPRTRPPMRIVVVGAGVGGLAAAVRLAAQGHEVVVLEQAETPGGKAGRRELDGFRFDTGPSLLTLPQVFRELFADTGGPLDEELELLAVEPVTRYRFADDSTVDLSANEERSVAALEEWSPGAGEDWRGFMATCARMWDASQAFLNGPPPWPPRRARPDERPPD